MGLLLALGLFSNIIYASIAGYVSQIDGKFTAAFFIGIAVFNIIMNGLKGLTLLVVDPASDDELLPIVAYFGLTIFLTFIGLGFHLIFMKSTFNKNVEEDKTDQEAFEGSESVYTQTQ